MFNLPLPSLRWDWDLPCSVKLKRGGSSFPFGSRVFGSLNSWKKGCAHACRGLILEEGVYSNNRATSSIASGGVLARNTWKQRLQLIITIYIKVSTVNTILSIFHLTATISVLVISFSCSVFKLHWVFSNVSMEYLH